MQKRLLQKVVNLLGAAWDPSSLVKDEIALLLFQATLLLPHRQKPLRPSFALPQPRSQSEDPVFDSLLPSGLLTDPRHLPKPAFKRWTFPLSKMTRCHLIKSHPVHLICLALSKSSQAQFCLTSISKKQINIRTENRALNPKSQPSDSQALSRFSLVFI
jgi:hypothetical protein